MQRYSQERGHKFASSGTLTTSLRSWAAQDLEWASFWRRIVKNSVTQRLHDISTARQCIERSKSWRVMDQVRRASQ